MSRPKKARLGRGLEALLGDVGPAAAADATAAAAAAAKTGGGALRELPVEQLSRGKYQPRSRMAQPALEELAETIRAQGVIQPLLVREVGRARYEIVAGERRWRAAQLAGLTAVPAFVRDISDRDAMAVALIENIQREDLNAIEEAAGFQRLLDDFGLTHQQIADLVGRSRAAVTNHLRLLTLHSTVKKQLGGGDLDMGHARALLALPTEAQPGAAAKVTAGRLSVRQTEALVKRLLADGEDGDGDGDGDGGGGGRGKTAARDADVARLEETLSQRLGARVAIRHSGNAGRVVIHYHSLDELDGIVERIK
ncbi:MAG: ParB/RepB/Spo0J family partition protein [Gammaproteobacteria bacterium]|nr:ParB/RepB/Spo0J family partition protein [Gammaproteobacteria bacterium]